jgi:hypothetical protein
MRHNWFYERGHTVLLPVREGEIWRVQIVWSNGAVHHFGKFVCEQDAVKMGLAYGRAFGRKRSGKPLIHHHVFV